MISSPEQMTGFFLCLFKYDNFRISFLDEVLQEISKSLGDLLSTSILEKKSLIRRLQKQQLFLHSE